MEVEAASGVTRPSPGHRGEDGPGEGQGPVHDDTGFWGHHQAVVQPPSSLHQARGHGSLVSQERDALVSSAPGSTHLGRVASVCAQAIPLPRDRGGVSTYEGPLTNGLCRYNVSSHLCESAGTGGSLGGQLLTLIRTRTPPFD